MPSYKLVDIATGTEIRPGSTVSTLQGNTYQLAGFTPPTSPDDKGRVHVASSEYGGDLGPVHDLYPYIIGAEFVEADRKEPLSLAQALKMADELAHDDWKVHVLITGNLLLVCPVCGALVLQADKLTHSKWHAKHGGIPCPS